MRISRFLPVTVILLLLATACGEADDGGRPPAKRAASPSPAPEPTSCANGGELIKAVEIPAVHADPVHVPGFTIRGQKYGPMTIPGVDIPAQRIPAQCVEIGTAPGGCLASVRIPPTSIPPVRIPPVKIPEVKAGGLHAKEVGHEGRSHEGRSHEGRSQEERCQRKPQGDGDWVPSVWRPSVWRPSVWRPAVWRPSVWRPKVCNDQNECIPEVTVPEVTVPEVTIPEVTVPEATIKEYTVGDSQIFKGDDAIAYSIKADVLFDFGKADVKPAAAAALKRVAEAIKRDVPSGASIRVDGHADGKGDDALNQKLSEQRAQAIVDWLATTGGIERSRLKATGYGETKPVASNTKPGGSDDPDARAKNRRVVISAQRK